MCVLLLTKDCVSHRWTTTRIAEAGAPHGTSNQGYPLYSHRLGCYRPLNPPLHCAAAWTPFVCALLVHFGCFQHCGLKSQSEIASVGQIPFGQFQWDYLERKNVQSGSTAHAGSVLLSCCQASIRNWLSPVKFEEGVDSGLMVRTPGHRVPAMLHAWETVVR